MSTDPYPEVSVDKSGIVPPQGARTSEWPKKLRTLTAAELDRLTIDNSGRFYWDGKLVNYDTQTKQLTDKIPNSLDRSMDILDRASFELGGRKPPATIEGELAPVDARRPAASRMRSTLTWSAPRWRRRSPTAAPAPVVTTHDRAEASDAVGLAEARRGRRGPRRSWSAPSAWPLTATSRRAIGAARPARSRTAARPSTAAPQRPDIPA